MVCRTWVDSLYIREVNIASAPPPWAQDYDYDAYEHLSTFTVLASFAPLQGLLTGVGRRFVTRTTFQGDGLTTSVGLWIGEATYVESALPCKLPLELTCPTV